MLSHIDVVISLLRVVCLSVCLSVCESVCKSVTENEQLDLEQGHGQGPQHQGSQKVKSI